MREKKFIDLADKLTSSIGKGEFLPGTALPTQSSLVSNYKISRSCVHKAFNVLEQRGLIDRRRGKGIFIRRNNSLQQKKLKSFVYLLPDYVRMETNPLDNYGLNILLGIEQYSQQTESNMIFKRINFNSDISRLNSQINDMNVEGIIVHKDVTDATIKKLFSVGIPIVTVGRTSELSEIGAVAPNFIDSFFELFKKLAGNAVSNVCVLYSSNDPSNTEFAILKEIAHLAKIKGINFIDFYERTLGYSSAIANIIEKQIRSNSLPEVFCCFNDWIAKHAIDALVQSGKSIPGDVGVIGALDFELARQIKPSLTTLAIDPLKIGYKAAELLQNMFNGAKPVTERIPMVLVQRESFKFNKDF